MSHAPRNATPTSEVQRLARGHLAAIDDYTQGLLAGGEDALGLSGCNAREGRGDRRR